MICIIPRRVPTWIPGTVLALSCVALTSLSVAQTVPQPKLPTVRLSAGLHNIVAEVASEPRQWYLGLMMRTQMAPHEGMLFVYHELQPPACFYMRNTLLPLSIAFIADDGTIVNIEDMQPRTEESHCAKRPLRYALEMNQGWFAKRGIKPGSRLGGGPFGP